MRRILWLDNDAPYLWEYRNSLVDAGYMVDFVMTPGAAEGKLNQEAYDLLILDARLPVPESDEHEYPPECTRGGYQTGLHFLRRNGERLRQCGTKVLVFTIVDQDDVRQAFEMEGVGPAGFLTKTAGSDEGAFLEAIGALLRSPAS